MILLYPFYNRLLAKPLVDSVLPLLNDKQHSLSDEKWYDFISDKDFTSFSYTFLVNVGLNECFIQVIFTNKFFVAFTIKYFSFGQND